MTDAAIPPRLSVWESDLFRHLSVHLEHEGALLAAYKALSEHADAEYVTYLVGMILEDEIRHHRLFTELVNTLRNRVEWTGRSGVPEVSDAANPNELLATTEKLLDRERADAQDLKRLSRELRDLCHTSVWPALVEVMQRDTEKHQSILGFVKQQLDRQLKRAPKSSA